MNGKEMRRYVWGLSKDRRKPIMLAALAVFFLVIFNTFILDPFVNIKHSLVGSWLISFLNNFLFLGVFGFSLVLLEEKAPKASNMLSHCKKSMFLKSIAAIVFIFVIPYAATYPIQILMRHGTALTNQATDVIQVYVDLKRTVVVDQALYFRGIVLFWAGFVGKNVASFALSALFFPLCYRLFLLPEEKLTDQIVQGCLQGVRHFKTIFVYRFWVAFPGLLYIAAMITAGFLYPAVAGMMTVGGIVGIWFYTPYYFLAEALLGRELNTGEEMPDSWDVDADEERDPMDVDVLADNAVGSFIRGMISNAGAVGLIQLRQSGKERAAERHMKLIKKDGWYYVSASGPIRGGPLPGRDRPV